MKLVTVARCAGCDWSADGDWTAADRAAEKHARKGHPTTIVTEAR